MLFTVILLGFRNMQETLEKVHWCSKIRFYNLCHMSRPKMFLLIKIEVDLQILFNGQNKAQIELFISKNEEKICFLFSKISLTSNFFLDTADGIGIFHWFLWPIPFYLTSSQKFILIFSKIYSVFLFFRNNLQHLQPLKMDISMQ